MRCPGQDMQFWGFDAIYEVECSVCGANVEFFRDDIVRVCRGCGNKLTNPRLNLGCAAHCPYGELCNESINSSQIVK